MDIFQKMVDRIIKEQVDIIGPLAVEQAQKVPGLSVNWQKHEVILQGNKTEIVEKLIEKYKSLFGQASVEACKEAVNELIAQVPKDQLPGALRS